MALPNLTYSLWVLFSSVWYALPDVKNLTFSDVYNEIPGIQFDYPANGVNKDKLQQYYPEVRVLAEGIEFPNRRFYLEDYEEQIAREGINSDTVNTYYGSGVAIKTEAILVYPPGGVSVSTLKTAGSNERTLGSYQGRTVVRNLWTEAEARTGDATGVIDLIGATSGTDAFGASWTSGGTLGPPNIIRSIAVGTSMRDVIWGLAKEGHFDVWTNGRDITVVRPDNVGGHWNADTDLKLEVGVDVLQGTSKISLKTTFSTVLGEGKECRFYERRNTTPETTFGFGRREAYASFGSNANDAALTAGTDVALTAVSALAEQRNYTIYPNGNNFNHSGASRNTVGLIPDADFRAGSYIKVKTSQLSSTTAGVLGETETMRVLSIAYKIGDNGRIASADLTLNTLFKSGEERLADATGSIVNGDEILERSPNPVSITNNSIVSTTSQSYVDTGTPVSLQFTVPPSGKVLIMINGELNNNTLQRWTHLSYRISGTDTKAANDDDAIYIIANQTNPRLGITQMEEGLTPGGLDTVTLSHRVDSLGASTGTYTRRRITVIPI